MRYWLINPARHRVELWEIRNSDRFGMALVLAGSMPYWLLDNFTESEIQRTAIEHFGVPLPAEYVTR